MNWRFWRQKHEKQGQPPNAVPLDLSARFDALERAMQLQILLMDDRTRIMADAMTAELQGLRTVMDKIAHDLAAIDAKVQGVRRPERRPIPAAELAVADGQDDLLLPPLPANDTPVERPDVDPMLLDALAKGRVGFGQIAVSSIPPRSPLLALMEFEAPLPLVDMATTDRLSELFPDAALLLDRFMMDAAASMVRAGQVPSDVPLLIPISPVSAQDAGLANDFRRRFERATHGGGIIPLVSETGWIALVEAGPERMATLAGPLCASPAVTASIMLLSASSVFAMFWLTPRFWPMPKNTPLRPTFIPPMLRGSLPALASVLWPKTCPIRSRHLASFATTSPWVGAPRSNPRVQLNQRHRLKTICAMSGRIIDPISGVPVPDRVLIGGLFLDLRGPGL
jgi:hypothetical protein